MKTSKWIVAMALALMMVGGAFGANKFTDPNCVALWRFEQTPRGQVDTNDTGPVGTNTLTAVNTPAVDAVNFKEGAASCDFEADDKDYFKITDAALSAGFPCKSGVTITDFSIVFWMKIESLPGSDGVSRHMADKGSGSPTTSSFMICQLRADGLTRMIFSTYDGESARLVTSALALAVNTWYHVQIRYDHDGGSTGGTVRIYDSGTGTTTKTVSAALVQTSTFLFTIGARSDPLESSTYMYDGLLDEVAVFNRLLTDDEFDKIRAGTFGQSEVGSLRRAWWWRRRDSH